MSSDLTNLRSMFKDLLEVATRQTAATSLAIQPTRLSYGTYCVPGDTSQLPMILTVFDASQGEGAASDDDLKRSAANVRAFRNLVPYIQRFLNTLPTMDQATALNAIVGTICDFQKETRRVAEVLPLGEDGILPSNFTSNTPICMFVTSADAKTYNEQAKRNELPKASSSRFKPGGSISAAAGWGEEAKAGVRQAGHDLTEVFKPYLKLSGRTK